jgi:hypothetical protein
MKHHTEPSISRLAWFEEFGVPPELGGCMCAECTGEAGTDLGPSLTSLVSATSALCR